MNLTTASNNQLKLLRKLNQKKYRFKKQLFLVEGRRAVRQIIENDAIQVQNLFFDESQQRREQDITDDAAPAVQSATVAKTDFQKISDTQNPQGVMAVCQMPDEIELTKLTKQQGVVLAADAIQDPGNMGTIIRTASWFGVKGLLSGKGTVDLFNPKTVRSTAGAIGTTPHRNVELENVLPKLENNGWQVCLLDASSQAANIRDVKPGEQTIFVVGNEGNGIRDSLKTTDRPSLRIPSAHSNPNVESLNAAISASIALYELTK